MADLHQNERAYQKQPTIFGGRERVVGKKTSKAGQRFTRSVGLGFKTPRNVSDVRGAGNEEVIWFRLSVVYMSTSTSA